MLIIHHNGWLIVKTCQYRWLKHSMFWAPHFCCARTPPSTCHQKSQWWCHPRTVQILGVSQKQRYMCIWAHMYVYVHKYIFLEISVCKKQHTTYIHICIHIYTYTYELLWTPFKFRVDPVVNPSTGWLQHEIQVHHSWRLHHAPKISISWSIWVIGIGAFKVPWSQLSRWKMRPQTSKPIEGRKRLTKLRQH